MIYSTVKWKQSFKEVDFPVISRCCTASYTTLVTLSTDWGSGMLWYNSTRTVGVNRAVLTFPEEKKIATTIM